MLIVLKIIGVLFCLGLFAAIIGAVLGAADAMDQRYKGGD